MPYLKLLKEKGYTVHLAYEKRGEIDFEMADKEFELSFERNPFRFSNIKSFWILFKIIQKQKYDLIHCHTPVISTLTRIAGAFQKFFGKTKILYTAHGYHFYKGGPLKLWTLFFPIEWALSFLTDAIILINTEDYLITKKYFLNKYTFQIKGIGVNNKKFYKMPKEEKMLHKENYGYSKDDFILLYIAEFIPRKNHEFLLNSFKAISINVPSAKLILVGTGMLFTEMKNLAAQLDISSKVEFLGWRDDTGILANISDLGVSTSKQEGLGLGLAEEMLCAIPIVASEDRGHKEMVEHGINGFMFKQNDSASFINYVLEIYNNPELYSKMSQNAYRKAQEFVIDNSLKKMDEIYSFYLKA